jgi:hypothetical protein
MRQVIQVSQSIEESGLWRKPKGTATVTPKHPSRKLRPAEYFFLQGTFQPPFNRCPAKPSFVEALFKIDSIHYLRWQQLNHCCFKGDYYAT